MPSSRDPSKRSPADRAAELAALLAPDLFRIQRPPPPRSPASPSAPQKVPESAATGLADREAGCGMSPMGTAGRRTKANAPPLPTTVRCAIYTRKSTEDGLEQEFNSLDAQREAGDVSVEGRPGRGRGGSRAGWAGDGRNGLRLDQPVAECGAAGVWTVDPTISSQKFS